MYQVYSYHHGNTAPTAEDLTDMIFGLELEIDDDSINVRELLDEAIAEDYLTSPENEHRTRNWKVIEEDSSVYREIILNADTIENILKRVRNLNSIGFSDEYIINSPATSAHIHINRHYLEKKGIRQSNIFKLLELYAPIIYKISGRDEDSFINWSEPRSRFEYHNIDWQNRAEQLEYISISNDRYTLVNCSRSSTIEMRGFSNYYNFDYDMIKCYLEFMEKCINQAEYMKGKFFINHYQYLLDDLEKWFKTNHAEIYYQFGLKQVFKNDKFLKQLQEKYYRTRSNDFYEINSFRTNHKRPYTALNYELSALTFLYRNRGRFNLKRMTFTPQGISNGLETAENVLYAEIGSYFMQYYRTLSHNEKTGGEL